MYRICDLHLWSHLGKVSSTMFRWVAEPLESHIQRQKRQATQRCLQIH